MNTTELLELKRKRKERQPIFVRQDGGQILCLGTSWRRPRGIHSKMRRHFKSRPAIVSIGYRSPRKVRELNRQGKKEIRVININDLKNVDPKTMAVIIGNIGEKKRIEILKACIEKKIMLARQKDPAIILKEIETKRAERQKKNQKSKPKEEPKKIEEKKEDKNIDEKKQDETKKGEKSERIKILEKRQ